MSAVEDEWMRLPGLFRWDEVCDVFAIEAHPDHEWRFFVRLAAPSPARAEPLYVVHAAINRVRRLKPRRNRSAHDLLESPVREPPR
jgi:hypothetical protein